MNEWEVIFWQTGLKTYLSYSYVYLCCLFLDIEIVTVMGLYQGLWICFSIYNEAIL